MPRRTEPIRIKIIGNDQFSKQLGGISKRLNRFSTQVTKVGRGMTAGLTLPIAAAGFAAYKVFDWILMRLWRTLAPWIPGQIDRLNQLKGGVQDLAIATGKSTDDIAGRPFSSY